MAGRRNRRTPRITTADCGSAGSAPKPRSGETFSRFRMEGVQMSQLRGAPCALALVCLIFAGCAGSPAEKAARHLKAAEALAQKKDYRREILELQNALQATPKN